MLSSQLGGLLRTARTELGMSRDALARRAGVSMRLVAELERGQRPNVSLESALKLFGAVGVTVVAKAPGGASAEIRHRSASAMERDARAVQRRRTWTGRHLHLRDEGRDPDGGQSRVARLGAVARISKQAYAFADAAPARPARGRRR